MLADNKAPQILSPTEKHNIVQKSLGLQAKHRSLLDCIGQSPASVNFEAAMMCLEESFSPFVNKENPKDKAEAFSPFVINNKGNGTLGRTPTQQGDATKEPASVTGEVGTFFAGKVQIPLI